jgi:hypothetical protein
MGTPPTGGGHDPAFPKLPPYFDDNANKTSPPNIAAMNGTKRRRNASHGPSDRSKHQPDTSSPPQTDVST